MSKQNILKSYYDEVQQKTRYMLNGVDVTDTIENLAKIIEETLIETKCRLFQLDMSVHEVKDKKIAELEKKLNEQPKQIIDKIIEEYNLNHKPIQNEFGDTMFGYATINADKLKEFLDNLLKGCSNE